MPSPTPAATITALEPLKPDLFERAWCSVPHPTLPLLATAHGKAVTVFSLTTRTRHSTITNGHERSVRSVSWKPGMPPGELCLVTGSFDATAGLWRWGEEEGGGQGDDDDDDEDEGGIISDLETDVTRHGKGGGGGGENNKDWQFTLVLEGHDSEVKCIAFSPSGAHVATSSRDKSVWVWEDVGDGEGGEDEWETVAVLQEHDGDVKSVAWCPDVPARNSRRSRRGGGGSNSTFGTDVLASASYDDTVRVWREDNDGEWVSVAVLGAPHHNGTVWGVVWEASEKKTAEHGFPRLATHSADGRVRIWKLEEDEVEDGGAGVRLAQGESAGAGTRNGLGGIPNTMRMSVKEDWRCEAVLPRVHEGDVYSVSWSARTGLLASTGSDGIVALYREEEPPTAAAEVDKSSGEAKADDETTTTEAAREEDLPGSRRWTVMATVNNAHGPYEVNHVTWCPRYDAGSDKKGVEEMLVTTGDDGVVRTWGVKIAP